MKFKEARNLNKGLSDKVSDLENSYAKLKIKYEKLYNVALILAGCSDHKESFWNEIEEHDLDPKNINRRDG